VCIYTGCLENMQVLGYRWCWICIFFETHPVNVFCFLTYVSSFILGWSFKANSIRGSDTLSCRSISRMYLTKRRRSTNCLPPPFFAILL
jgi:hypothetical protein